MGLLDRFRGPQLDVAGGQQRVSVKGLSTYGTPVTMLAAGYIEQPDLETHLTTIIIHWLAEALSRAEIEVHDADDVRIKGHPVERAYMYPKGGRGQFWRGTVRDWLLTGLWAHGFDRTQGRRIYRVKRLPRSQLQLPADDNRQKPVWLWSHSGEIEHMKKEDFVWGIWNEDVGNQWNGKSPLDSPGVRNILRLSRAALKYEFDGFMRSGGKGLLIADPALSNQIRFQGNLEAREAYRAGVQQRWEDATTGENRGAPIITDGIETTVQEYGVNLAELNMREVHSFCAEMLLALFQLPPSSVGIRIDRDPTYANSRTWESIAFERGVLPRQLEIAERIGETLLTQIERQQRGYRVVFRTDDAVRAKLEDRQILEKMALDRLDKGAAAVWEVREQLEGLDPDFKLQEELHAAHLLRLTGATPQMTVDDPRMAQVIAEAIYPKDDIDFSKPPPPELLPQPAAAPPERGTPNGTDRGRGSDARGSRTNRNGDRSPARREGRGDVDRRGGR